MVQRHSDGNCSLPDFKGNSALILTAGIRVGGLRPELQNRFRLKCEMEFGILGQDDGLPGFLDWKRNLVLWPETGRPVY